MLILGGAEKATERERLHAVGATLVRQIRKLIGGTSDEVINFFSFSVAVQSRFTWLGWRLRRLWRVVIFVEVTSGPFDIFAIQRIVDGEISEHLGGSNDVVEVIFREKGEETHE